VVVENLDHVDMPFGLGLHPYTAIAPDALLEIPAHASWPHEGGIPTGTPTPVAGPWRWRELAEGASTLLTDLPLEDLEARAGAVSLRWPGDRFGEVTLYRPPGRPSVCVEPWTSVSNAAAQIAPGATHGLVVIPPMQPWRAWLEIAPA
jgi:galactose mutarotase-like enzyme